MAYDREPDGDASGADRGVELPHDIQADPAQQRSRGQKFHDAAKTASPFAATVGAVGGGGMSLMIFRDSPVLALIAILVIVLGTIAIIGMKQLGSLLKLKDGDVAANLMSAVSKFRDDEQNRSFKFRFFKELMDSSRGGNKAGALESAAKLIRPSKPSADDENCPPEGKKPDSEDPK